MFIGRLSTTLSVDPKGRLVVPTRIRDRLEAKDGETEVMIGVFASTCLTLYSLPQYELMVTAMESALGDDLEDQAKKRRFYGSFTNVIIDKAGRITIPALFLKRADIHDEVVVIGMKDRVEFWNPEKFASHEDTGPSADDAATMGIIGRACRAISSQGTKENA